MEENVKLDADAVAENTENACTSEATLEEAAPEASVAEVMLTPEEMQMLKRTQEIVIITGEEQNKIINKLLNCIEMQYYKGSKV